jgi:outer membrane lipoprotein SlyB
MQHMDRAAARSVTSISAYGRHRPHTLRTRRTSTQGSVRLIEGKQNQLVDVALSDPALTVSGAITAAAMGGVLGTTFGPVGSAIGGVAGALAGAAAFHAAAQDEADKNREA